MGRNQIIQQVITARTDFSQYLIHWTKQDKFNSIIRDGFMIASNALKPAGLDGEKVLPTISSPAVCFSETPIGNYLQAVSANELYSSRQYGIAFHKRTLYKYGARPVLYGDESFCARLKPEDRYLFCHFDYFAENRGWTDWTHEREWRVRPNIALNDAIGLRSTVSVRKSSGRLFVPVHFPSIDKRGDFKSALPENPEFILIVRIEEDKYSAKNLIETMVKATSYSKAFYPKVEEYRDKYLVACAKAHMVSLEEAKDKCENAGRGRLEDFIPSTAD